MPLLIAYRNIYTAALLDWKDIHYLDGIFAFSWTVEIMANVSAKGMVRLRVNVFNAGTEYYSGAPEKQTDYIRSSNLTDYYADKIKIRLR